jgi:hypothetical protein
MQADHPSEGASLALAGRTGLSRRCRALVAGDRLPWGHQSTTTTTTTTTTAGERVDAWFPDVAEGFGAEEGGGGGGGGAGASGRPTRAASQMGDVDDDPFSGHGGRRAGGAGGRRRGSADRGPR